MKKEIEQTTSQKSAEGLSEEQKAKQEQHIIELRKKLELIERQLLENGKEIKLDGKFVYKEIPTSERKYETITI